MKYDLMLFDFDGTLMDTSPGIFHCARRTMEELGIPVSADVNMNLFVGPPLGDCFRITFGLEEKYIAKACEIYRRRYAREGRFMADFYPGVPQTLRLLRGMGMRMAVTTMKAAPLAGSMVEHFGIGECFFRVFGADMAGVKTKADLVRDAVSQSGACVSPDRVLLVGDTMLDAAGAKETGVDFLGVAFGFGDFSAEQMAGFNHPLLERFADLVDFVK